MPNPYEVSLRKRAVLAYERGEGSYAEVAGLFDLNRYYPEAFAND